MHYIVCVHVCIKHLWNFVHNRNVSRWDSLCVLVFKFISVTCRHRIQGATVISQVAKTLGSTSTWHRSDTFASDQCLIDVEQRVFAIWDMHAWLWYGCENDYPMTIDLTKKIMLVYRQKRTNYRKRDDFKNISWHKDPEFRTNFRWLA